MNRLNTSINAETVATISGRITEFCLAAILFVAPLALAGRFAPGRLLLAILVAVTTLAWFVSRAFTPRERVSWLWTGAEWVACCAILLTVLQIVPLSASTRDWVTPAMPQLLPLHRVDGLAANAADAGHESAAALDPAAEVSRESGYRFPEWNTASLAPHATRGGVAMTILYVVIFFVVLQRARRRSDVETLLKAVAIAGVSMAVLGLLQKLFGNGRFLWFMAHPSRDTLVAVKGTFVNENHFAHYLALSIGPLLWWLVKIQEETGTQKVAFGAAPRHAMSMRQVGICAGLGAVLLAGLLTYSRGGLAVMMLATVVTTGFFVYQKRVGRNAIIAVTLVSAVAVLALWIHGQEILSRELASLQDISVETLDKDAGRRKIWTAVLKAVPDFAMLGSGVGSHRYVYPTFFEGHSQVQYTHAESGFLNVLLETGGPGFGLLLVGIGFFARWLIRPFFNEEKPELAFLAVPLVSGFCVSVAHGIFDFNWYIPANMTMTLVLAALAARLWDLSRGGHYVHLSKFAWSAVGGVAVASTAFSAMHFVPPARAQGPWHEYMAWSLATNRFQEKSIGPGRQKDLGFVDGSDPDNVDYMIDLLDEALELDPRNGRAHVRMASMCMRQFELKQADSDNAMNLAQIRDAALASEFPSHQAMSDWVTKVVGENRQYLDRVLWHSQQGIRSTPTEGRGYMLLGEVAFLDPELTGSEYELLRQAYAVRPYDSGVQFVYGRQKMLAGESEDAMQLWKEAFARGHRVRKRIIDAVGFQAPPEEILGVFQPDVDGLRDLFEYYRHREFVAQMTYVGERYVAELERQAKLISGATAGKLWFDAQFVHATLGNVEAAVIAAESAIRDQPAEFRNHEACALRMRDAGRFEDAIRQFEWCEARQPNEDKWPKAILQMRREMRQSQTRTARQTTPGAVRQDVRYGGRENL